MRKTRIKCERKCSRCWRLWPAGSEMICNLSWANHRCADGCKGTTEALEPAETGPDYIERDMALTLALSESRQMYNGWESAFLAVKVDNG